MRASAATHFVARDGQVIRGEDVFVHKERRRAFNTVKSQQITSDQMERHHRLLRRQHFMEKPPKWD